MKIKGKPGFTLIELLTVISIIIVLAGLVIGTAGYIQQKAARARAQAEIVAISSACESYKAENGAYPMDSGSATSQLYPAGANVAYDPASANATTYQNACAVLYQALTNDGNTLLGGSSPSKGQLGSSGNGGKIYLTTLKPSQTGSNGTTYYIQDPFGFCYGYSTAMATSGTNGYNPTFDLWSTAGTTTSTASLSGTKWITNWSN